MSITWKMEPSWKQIPPRAVPRFYELGRARGPRRCGQSRLPLLLLVVLLVVGIAGWFLLRPDPAPGELEGNGQGGEQIADGGEDPVDRQDEPITEALLAQAVEAVAASENADYERAIELWKQLHKAVPGDADVQLNLAVTILKWIDESNKVLASGKVTDPDELARLESDLTNAFGEADQIIEPLATLDAAKSRAALLQAALLEAKAQQMEYPQDLEVQRAAIAVLTEALQSDPAQPLLAGKLEKLARVVGGDNDSALAKTNGDALYASWKLQPRNLFLLSRAADVLLQNKDVRAVELLDASLEVTKPMLSQIARRLVRKKPDEMVQQAKDAIAQDDWRTAQRVRQWLNLFMGMSGFRPDERLINPDVMALLDVTFLARFSRQLDLPEGVVTALPTFSTTTVHDQCRCFTWIDYDLDLDFDIALATDDELLIYENVDGKMGREPVGRMSLPEAIDGMIAADLFEVDNPIRPRLASNVEELIEDNPGETAVSDSGVQNTADEFTSGARHDTYQELLIWGLEAGLDVVHVEPEDSAGSNTENQNLTLSLVEGEDDATGLEGIVGPTNVVLFDIESDGDLDLFVAAKNGCDILQNNGNRTFESIGEFSQWDDWGSQITSMAVLDFDSDLDQDIVAVASNKDRVVLFENILHGQLRAVPLEDEGWPRLTAPSSVSVGELDGNSSFDLVVADQQQVTTTWTRTPVINTILPSQSREQPAVFSSVELADVDNDSHLDLIGASTEGLVVVQSNGKEWSSSSSTIATGTVGTFSVIDSDQDGQLEIAAIKDGQLILLSPAEVEQSYVNVRVRGIKDTNGGGRINHYAVGTILELWSGKHQMRRIVKQPATHFGLGAGTADNLRVVFPNGLTQNLESPPINQLVEEKQELKGSCPFLYGWDGERFALITDLLWAAPLGLQVAPGEVIPDRRWEYLLLPGEAVQPRDGMIELRVTEELWEFAYFDQLELIAVDHPIGTRVFSNEKVGPPFIAEPKVFAITKTRRPTVAVDKRGRDLRKQLAEVDRQYVTPFEHQYCQGLTEPHFVELDFGDLSDLNDPKLVLTGWMFPTDTSLNIAIAQDERLSLPEEPTLWLADETGQWQCVQPVMGFPGGKPKSIVVDLSNLPSHSHVRLRIAGSQQIYWDQAFVGEHDASVPVIQQTLEIESADLRFRGFSQLMPREPDQPHWYDYERMSTLPKWPALEGPFTRFGEVAEILTADDDRMVVMTSGDEIAVRFHNPQQALPNGWKRDYVLHSVGWDKDADLNTLAGQTSLPLPFQAQKRYPPAIDQLSESAEVERLNRDTLTRSRQYNTEPAAVPTRLEPNRLEAVKH